MNNLVSLQVLNLGDIPNYQKSLFLHQHIGLNESGTVEFKGGSDQNKTWTKSHLKDSINKNLSKYVVGFLNSNSNAPNASIYFGVHDTGIIQGTKLSASDVDRLDMVAHRKISDTIYPSLEKDRYSIIWHKLLCNKPEPSKKHNLPEGTDESVVTYVRDLEKRIKESKCFTNCF